MTDKVLIELKDARYVYPAEEGEPSITAVDGVSLKIREGEFVAILGHNGSGKSTLAKLMNAILLPTGGEVVVMGKSASDDDAELFIRRNVGLVFQNPDNQIVATIVEEDVAFGPENLALERDEIRRRVDEALRTVDMYDKRFHEPHKLSGGQKQRVAIAGILAMEPRVVVLDEPTAMLDPKGRAEIIDYMRRLNKEKNITIVLITHYMDEAAWADTVYVMKRGKIVMNGAPHEVLLNEKELSEASLSLPDSARLVSMLRKCGVDAQPALTPDELVVSLENLLRGGAK